MRERTYPNDDGIFCILFPIKAFSLNNLDSHREVDAVLCSSGRFEFLKTKENDGGLLSHGMETERRQRKLHRFWFITNRKAGNLGAGNVSKYSVSAEVRPLF